ncbi:MAG: translation elongation factor Ts [Candidatus Portnoybacteria bacterium]|nr:translation elongation factor Ts [Candidatus Portnoybacteria bacterium]
MITSDQVKQLRDKTQSSMMECKKALEEAGGDFNKALELLQRRGKQIAEKRAEKETKAGVVEAYIHPNKKIGVLVELNCETDFVAKNETFKELAHDLAMHIAAMNPLYLSPEDIPQEYLDKQKQGFGEEFQNSGKPEAVISQIIEGKIRKIGDEICLLEQAFVKNPDQKIKDLVSEYVGKIGEKIKVGRFIRFEL